MKAITIIFISVACVFFVSCKKCVTCDVVTQTKSTGQPMITSNSTTEVCGTKDQREKSNGVVTTTSENGGITTTRAINTTCK